MLYSREIHKGGFSPGVDFDVVTRFSPGQDYAERR